MKFNKRELPQFLRDLLAKPPQAGEGVHIWLFKIARQLHAHLPAVEIIALLESKVANCGRHVPRAEIVSAVQNALASAWHRKDQAAPVQSGSKWPGVNTERRAAIIRDGGALAELWERSVPGVVDNAGHTEEIIAGCSPAIRFCAAVRHNSILTPSRAMNGADNSKRYNSSFLRPCRPSSD